MRVKEECPDSHSRDYWEKVSQKMKAKRFDRPALWCKKRWTELHRQSKSPWSPAENNALRTLKTQYTNWRVISLEMTKLGRYRDAERCMAQWQDVVRPKPSNGLSLSPQEAQILNDLKAKGYTYRHIADELECQLGSYRTHTSLKSAWPKLNGYKEVRG